MKPDDHKRHGRPQESRRLEGGGCCGSGDHHAHMVRDFRRRFWISIAVTIPVLALSPSVQSLLGFSLSFRGDRWLLLILSTFIYAYGGWPFLKGAAEEIATRRPGMMTLIGLAVSVAYGYSALVVAGLKGEIFFWELVTLIDIMLLGHWIEMRSVMGASRALEEMVKLLPSEAHLIGEDGSARDVPIAELRKGDRVLVRPGEKMPADGIVLEGESELNESMITGESRPVEKRAGGEVIGGSVNGTGALTIEVKNTGEESYLSRVIEMVRKAGESKSRAQDLADRAAFWLTVSAISVGGITLASWLLSGADFAFSLERMVTVMVITCPHALGLAVPLVIAVITALAAKHGLLIRNRTSFETARVIDTVIFDKTGTLTRGDFGVTDLVSLGKWSGEDLLRRAASVEAGSEHTIGRAIVRAAGEKGLDVRTAGRFTSVPGKGAMGEVDGEEVWVGSPAMVEALGIAAGGADAEIKRIASAGKAVVLVATAGGIQGVIGLADVIREESREAVQTLRECGIAVAMITGDNEATAAHVARELGIDAFFAGILPDRKSEKIRELQERGKKVAMVGDGMNDAPALAQADLGIAIGAGTDVAVESADVILVDNDPRNVADVVSLSRIAHRKMVQNLAWATGYNVIAIPLAAGVLFRWGVILPPAVGALVMSVSTVIVAVNARLIGKLAPRRQFP